MQAWTPLWTWFSTSSHTVILRSKPLLSWTELGSVLPKGRGIVGYLLTASIASLFQGSPETVHIRTSRPLVPWTRLTSRFLIPFFLLPEPAVIVSSNLAGKKQQPCSPQTAGICGPTLPSPLRLPAWQPTALDGAPTLGPSPCSPAKPASPVYVCCSYFCLCTWFHKFHCSSFLPAGLLKACCSLYHPP